MAQALLGGRGGSELPPHGTRNRVRITPAERRSSTVSCEAGERTGSSSGSPLPPAPRPPPGLLGPGRRVIRAVTLKADPPARRYPTGQPCHTQWPADSIVCLPCLLCLDSS